MGAVALQLAAGREGKGRPPAFHAPPHLPVLLQTPSPPWGSPRLWSHSLQFPQGRLRARPGPARPGSRRLGGTLGRQWARCLAPRPHPAPPDRSAPSSPTFGAASGAQMQASAGAVAAAPAAAPPASPAAAPSPVAVRSPAKGAASPKPLLTRYARECGVVRGWAGAGQLGPPAPATATGVHAPCRPLLSVPHSVASHRRGPERNAQPCPCPVPAHPAAPATDRCPACGAPPLSEQDLQIVRKPGRRSTRDAQGAASCPALCCRLPATAAAARTPCMVQNAACSASFHDCLPGDPRNATQALGSDAAPSQAAN